MPKQIYRTDCLKNEKQNWWKTLKIAGSANFDVEGIICRPFAEIMDGKRKVFNLLIMPAKLNYHSAQRC